MTPVLYPANETAFTSNGLGRLSGAISCNVHEAINGAYELVMVYPIDGIHYEDIAEGRYIYAAHDDSGVKEPFEIFEISRPFDGKVEIHAWHWSYRLNKVTVLPHVSSSAQAAVQDIKNYAANDCPFTFSTDISSTSQQTVKVPTSARSLMGGVKGSVIDTYGGEWEFLGSRCILRSQRGTDSGVTIKYGKNLTDAKKTTSTENVWTGIIPYYTDGDNCVFYNGIIYSGAKDDYAYTMVIPVDASTSFESAPTQAQLKTWGTAYVKSNAKTSLPTSIDISFVQLWQTEEYADVAPLQRLYIGDTVTIQYAKLGISNKARIVEYDYNVLLERYDSMTVGNVRADFASTVQGDIVRTTTQMSSKFAAELQRATNAITGVSGGAFVINTDANGHPYETLWMNTDDKKTATRVIRINYEGIAMGRGYNGPFNSAWLSMDGTFDAQNINVVHLDAGSIETGLLQSTNGKVKFDVDAGTLTLGNKALRITAGNFQLKENGDVIIKGTLTNNKRSLNTSTNGVYIGTDGISVGTLRGGSADATGFRATSGGIVTCGGIRFFLANGNEAHYGLWAKNGGSHIGSAGPCDFNSEGNGVNYLRGGTWVYNGMRVGGGMELIGDLNFSTEHDYNINGVNEISASGKITCEQVIQTSDERAKEDIEDLDGAEEFVAGLRPVRYRFKGEDEYHHGFVAQEVREIADSGIVAEDADGMLGISYTDIIADLVSVVQKQREQINNLEARLARVEALLEGDWK